MPIPLGYQTLFEWFNDVVGKLSNNNQEFAVFQKYWPQFTAAQKNQIRNLAVNAIDSAVSDLNDIKNEITNTPD